MLNRPGARRALRPLALLLAAGLAVPAAKASALTALSTSLGLGAALASLTALRGGASPLALAGVGALVVASLVWAQRRGGVGPSSPHAAEQALLAMARERFVALQAAWDRGDVEALRALTTDGMLDELLDQLPERGPGPNRTDVLSLEARLLAHEKLDALEFASVEFSGMVREGPGRHAAPFREIWMLARSAGEPDWRLARQQALL
ncbi:Tim44 domain-containing protein [Piscinibacter defluvii]|uniref:Tim44 domain-containing protein n=1 Tax=Piscinibacter defluvii TaxID=1796922 RepID=UPI001F0B7A19|nr:Tim44-like domain-containing protein [Piscinibacter defluvii]